MGREITVTLDIDVHRTEEGHSHWMVYPTDWELGSREGSIQALDTLLIRVKDYGHIHVAQEPLLQAVLELLDNDPGKE